MHEGRTAHRVFRIRRESRWAGRHEGTALARAKADADSAAFIGAQVLHVFARHTWPDTVEEQERFWAPMIEDFQELADYCAERGVVASLQNHNHGSFAMNANQVLRILREVGRKNFTYILDSGQWEGARGGSPRGWYNTELDIYEAYHKRVAPYATGVRAKIYKIDNGFEEWLDYPASSASSETSTTTARYQSCSKGETYRAIATTTGPASPWPPTTFERSSKTQRPSRGSVPWDNLQHGLSLLRK